MASQAGLGVAPITVSRRFEQGTVQNTGGLLDAAIQGEGFCIVKDNDLVHTVVRDTSSSTPLVS